MSYALHCSEGESNRLVKAVVLLLGFPVESRFNLSQTRDRHRTWTYLAGGEPEGLPRWQVLPSVSFLTC